MKGSKIIEDYNDIFLDYDTSKNTTRNIMTKYEKTAVLALRLEQLMRGAAPCVDAAAEGLRTMREIALKELDTRKLPFIIMRTLPNSQREYWKLRDLVILRE